MPPPYYIAPPVHMCISFAFLANVCAAMLPYLPTWQACFPTSFLIAFITITLSILLDQLYTLLSINVCEVWGVRVKI